MNGSVKFLRLTVIAWSMLHMALFCLQGAVASGNGLTPTKTGYDFSVTDLEGQTEFDLGTIMVNKKTRNKMSGVAWKNTTFSFYPVDSKIAKLSFKVKKEGDFKRKISTLSSGEYRFVIKVSKDDVTDNLEWGIQGTIYCK